MSDSLSFIYSRNELGKQLGLLWKVGAITIPRDQSRFQEIAERSRVSEVSQFIINESVEHIEPTIEKKGRRVG
ncbi:hypothetical protein BWQ96_04478 [Gracilariopsis chorda]|uniref:Uncharacterized protein n=1 Tax=Gracilariopsis chorda TaxID=448386 RepID=A0A2V3IX45_9FLOR|nr:hypothetical protein BWQ96_04478 [Gracilariopsis chorda]|eukprot:PXF45710.1 hypothetical protein BWQ96_04478 [Gracilariopsis chorda]